MGCDIHLFVERKVGNVWKKVADKEKKFYQPRNYALFGLLADVRNHNMPTIKPPQGIPEDVSKGIAKQWNKDKRDCHTPTFYTLAELLSVKDKSYEVTCCLGVSDWKEYKKKGELQYSPDHYFYQPKGAQLITNERMERILNLTAFLDENEFFTTLEKQVAYKEVDSIFWEELVPAMQGLSKDPNMVRGVFWFDS